MKLSYDVFKSTLEQSGIGLKTIAERFKHLQKPISNYWWKYAKWRGETITSTQEEITLSRFLKVSLTDKQDVFVMFDLNINSMGFDFKEFMDENISDPINIDAIGVYGVNNNIIEDCLFYSENQPCQYIINTMHGRSRFLNLFTKDIESNKNNYDKFVLCMGIHVFNEEKSFEYDYKSTPECGEHVVSNNLFKYKNFVARIEYSQEDEAFVGRVLEIEDSISFEGDAIEDAVENFHQMIEFYISDCKELNKDPFKKEYECIWTTSNKDVHDADGN